MAHHVVTLPGDGIGPEIMAAAIRVLEQVGEFDFEEHVFGGASIDAQGTALTDEVLAACGRSDAVLLAAVGGPKWDTTDPSRPRPEQGLLNLRKGLGLYANLRPVKPIEALYDASPLREERIRGTDMLLVRELTGGIYFGEKTRTADSASDVCAYTTAEIERIAQDRLRGRPRQGHERRQGQRARDLAAVAPGRQRPPRQRVPPHHPRAHAGRQRRHAARVRPPRHFDTIVTENMFGDILSDEAAMLTGSIGMLPSASLGDGGPGLFEPVHGSAPDIAGQGVANPLAMFLSAAMMLRHGLDLEAQAAAVESAVQRALAAGLRTPDLGGESGTAQATDAVLENL